MTRGKVLVTIDRPIDDVFAVLSDAEQTPLWYPETVEERWLTDGPLGVGSRRLAVTKSFGIRTENEAVLTVYEPNEKLVIEGVDTPVPFEISIDFSPEPDGTRVNWDVEMTPNLLMKPIVALTFGPFLRQLQRALNNLKTMMEAGEL